VFAWFYAYRDKKVVGVFVLRFSCAATAPTQQADFQYALDGLAWARQAALVNLLEAELGEARDVTTH
jgi:hypothetical protein